LGKGLFAKANIYKKHDIPISGDLMSEVRIKQQDCFVIMPFSTTIGTH